MTHSAKIGVEKPGAAILCPSAAGGGKGGGAEAAAAVRADGGLPQAGLRASAATARLGGRLAREKGLGDLRLTLRESRKPQSALLLVYRRSLPPGCFEERSSRAGLRLVTNDVFTERQRFTTGTEAAEKKLERHPPGFASVQDAFALSSGNGRGPAELWLPHCILVFLLCEQNPRHLAQ